MIFSSFAIDVQSMSRFFCQIFKIFLVRQSCFQEPIFFPPFFLFFFYVNHFFPFQHFFFIFFCFFLLIFFIIFRNFLPNFFVYLKRQSCFQEPIFFLSFILYFFLRQSFFFPVPSFFPTFPFFSFNTSHQSTKALRVDA